uniref:Uncharacterized protein n=1 Tax=Romanomermis culicivorax TaxID=13658 RepID=A0A915KWB7_ROMCU
MAFWKLRCLQQQNNNERPSHNYQVGNNCENTQTMKISPNFRNCANSNYGDKENGQLEADNGETTICELYARPLKHTSKNVAFNGIDPAKKLYTPRLANKTPSIGPIIVKTLSYEKRQISPTVDNMVDAPSLALLQKDQQESYLSSKMSSIDKEADIRQPKIASSKMVRRGETPSKTKQFHVLVQQRKTALASLDREGRSPRAKLTPHNKDRSLFTTTISIPFRKSSNAAEGNLSPPAIATKFDESLSPTSGTNKSTAKEMYPCFLIKNLAPEATPYVPVQVFAMMLVKND